MSDILRKRGERNAALIAKVKAGEMIEPVVSTQALFFPPRPAVAKDRRLIAMLFGEEDIPQCLRVLPADP